MPEFAGAAEFGRIIRFNPDAGGDGEKMFKYVVLHELAHILLHRALTATDSNVLGSRSYALTAGHGSLFAGYLMLLFEEYLGIDREFMDDVFTRWFGVISTKNGEYSSLSWPRRAAMERGMSLSIILRSDDFWDFDQLPPD